MTDDLNWRQANNGSIFFDARTFSSLEEMRGSLLEACCPGDGVLSGALSLITTAVTPIILSIPLAFAVGGWTFAAGSIAFCIAITFLSVRILAMASISADSDDYETVAGFFFGAKAKWTVRVVMFIYNYGCSVVYLSFIKDSLTPILVGKCTFLPNWMRSEKGSALFLLLSMIVITPLTFNSRLASLRTKGFISNLLIIFIIVAVGYRYFVPAPVALSDVPPPPTTTEEPLLQTSLITNQRITALLPYMFVAPIFVFSYEVQSNVMAVIKDLHDRTGHKILVSILLALLVTTSFYVSMGIFGSLTFPSLTQGNILASYDIQDDFLMLLCNIFCCFSAAVSFVFCAFPVRQAAFMFLSDGKSPKIPKRMRVRLGLAISITATILAIFLPDVAQVVSVLGAIFSSTLSMTLPSLLAMAMRRSGTYLTSYADAVLSWLLLGCGIVFSFVGTFMAVVFSS